MMQSSIVVSWATDELKQITTVFPAGSFQTGCTSLEQLSLTLVHAQGYSSRRVCLSICQSVCQLPVMASSNGHKSETTSSITTKRGIGMGSVAFSDVIPLINKT